MSNTKIYFPGLNGVRFVAVFIVILDHLELFKGYFKINTLWPDSFSSHMGKFGVTMFFVLSGYLITYLLLAEKKESGTIAIKNFYIRRILRIWPLYFILMILGFFILPHFDFFTLPLNQPVATDFLGKFMLFLFFLANVAFVFYPVVAFAGVLWSVAVEEQFYLIWPNLIKKFKNVLYTLLVCLLIYLLVKFALIFNVFEGNSVLINKLVKLMERTRFSSMIIGGLGAFVVFNQKEFLLKYIYSPLTQVLSYVLLLLLFLNVIQLPYFDLVKNEFSSAIVAIIIVNVSTNKQTLLRLENTFFDFLGKISYGMYIYHSIVAVICIKLFTAFIPSSSAFYLPWSLLLILSTLLLTIFVSYLSYTYIELKILKRKKNYSLIVSGDQAKEK